MKLTTAIRNTRATDIITAAGTNPKYKFYTGTESLTPAGTLLATLNVTGALGTATSGVIDINEVIFQTNSSHVAGTPTFCLITTSADAAVATLTIPGNMNFTGTVSVGVDVALTAPCTITEGNA